MSDLILTPHLPTPFRKEFEKNVEKPSITLFKIHQNGPLIIQLLVEVNWSKGKNVFLVMFKFLQAHVRYIYIYIY